MQFQKVNIAMKDHRMRKEIQTLRIIDRDSSIRVTITRPKSYESELLNKYSVTKYKLVRDYVFPDELHELIPTNTPTYIDNGERYLKRVLRALYFFKQCALIGPSGTGKTHVAYLAAEIAGLPIWEVNCSLQTSVYDLFGRYIGLGKENWVDGQIVSWARHGGILYLDEANMMKQDIATRLNPLLDTRGHMVLTEKDNEIITRHKFAYVIISMNPYSAEFVGTKPLNTALRQRLSAWISFDYLSVGNIVNPEEVKLVQEKAHIHESIANRIVQVGAELRKQYKAGDIPYAPSVGGLIKWGQLVHDGEPPLSAAKETIITVTSDNMETQEMIQRVVKMFFNEYW